MAESQGALTEAVFYILLSLFCPMHGYGIMQNVKQLSGGRVSLGAGTLYGAMNTLVEKGWITPCAHQKDERKKEYVITKEGLHAAKAELLRLHELLENGRQVLGGQLK
jgi:DNA-binding PadR family transcriptional regulator